MPKQFLTTSGLERILASLPSLTVGVVGDLFLDRYLDIDASLTEPSLETGLDAYQVVRVRPSPGAAGTVINNLVALGVKEVRAVSVIGDDGEGYELLQTLAKQGLSRQWLVVDPARRTPTYTKPILHEDQQQGRELNRLDIKNRTPLPAATEERVIASLGKTMPGLDAVIVLDQVSEENCGVLTTRVRQYLSSWCDQHPDRLVLADSRERIGWFRSMWLKPNGRECRQAVSGAHADPAETVRQLARQVGRPVFCTQGEQGILVVDPRPASPLEVSVPAFPVSGPIDPVGAGDSTSAALACALAAGRPLPEAAAFANLVASITIQQLGTTGTASPTQVRQAWERNLKR